MASFTLKFSAYTSGVHKIAWRTFETPVGEYNYTSVNVNNATYPTQVSVTIPVNGNLYCADDGNGRTGIEFTGWILPMCYGETYQPGHTVPDHATEFVHVVDKVNSSCHNVSIEMIGKPISIFVNNPGSGYDDQTQVVVTRDPNDNFTTDAEPYVVLDGNGGILTIEYHNDNRGCYDESCPLPTISVVGNGSGANLGVALNIGLKEQMSEYACDGYYGDPNDYIKQFDNLGDSVDMCANVNSLSNLKELFTYTDNGPCNCCECSNVSIDTSAANDGYCIIWYNTCWDANGSITLYIEKVQSNSQVTLQNVILDSLYIAENTLNNSGTPVDPIIS